MLQIALFTTMLTYGADSLPIEQVPTYWEPDGNFPDHEPNPLLPENRQFIIDRVRAEGMAWLVEPTKGRWFTPGFMADHPDRAQRLLDMIASVDFERSTFAAPPQRFEAGKPMVNA